MSCRCTPGTGTVFQLHLSIIADMVLPETGMSTPIQPGNERILFIDDDKIPADMGKAMFKRIGCRVTLRINSIEALISFQNEPAAFDPIIADQTMSGMTEINLDRRMLSIRPDPPTILSTGSSCQIFEEKARSFGVESFAMG